MGAAGAQGPKGDKGDKGERGSEWLALTNDPPQPVDGRDGDWYIDATGQTWNKQGGVWSKNFKYFSEGVQEVVSEDLLKKMVRYNNGWLELPVDAPAATAPNVGKSFVWRVTAVGTGAWAEFTPPAFPEPTADGKNYGRARANGQTNGAWVEIPAPGIADITGATVGAFYVREATSTTVGKWTLFAGLVSPTTAGKKYLRTSTAWEEFNTYTLLVQKVLDVAATTAVDLRTNQVVRVLNNTNTAKVINFTNPPDVDRAQTVVVVVTGNQGTVEYRINGSTANVKMNGEAPLVYTAGRNVVTFFVDTDANGTYAIGAAGAATVTP